MVRGNGNGKSMIRVDVARTRGEDFETMSIDNGFKKFPARGAKTWSGSW